MSKRRFTARPDSGRRCHCQHCDQDSASGRVCQHCGYFFDATEDLLFQHTPSRLQMRAHVWFTSNMEYVHVDEMDTDYIMNCLRLLVRRGWTRRADAISRVLSEGKRAAKLKGKQAELYSSLLRTGYRPFMSGVFYVMIATLQSRDVVFGLKELDLYFEHWRAEESDVLPEG
jgi:hypothetical protein